jgi:hypothetical protein
MRIKCFSMEQQFRVIAEAVSGYRIAL